MCQEHGWENGRVSPRSTHRARLKPHPSWEKVDGWPMLPYKDGARVYLLTRTRRRARAPLSAARSQRSVGGGEDWPRSEPSAYNPVSPRLLPMKVRTNTEWLAALKADGAPQTAALSDLRAYLLRASRYALSRSRNALRLAPSDLDQLAEDSARDALSSLLEHLHEFRGERRFTTWAYKFAINAALVTARR